jgi:hypothetical protein
MLHNANMHEMRANLQEAGVSFTAYNGKEFMVAPCIALVPGLLKGEMVTLEEVRASYQDWRDIPVVINHPYNAQGKAISAIDPNIIAERGVGHIAHVSMDDDRLKFNVWIDVAKSMELGGDARKAMDMVKNGEPLEVSTGYFAVSRDKRGIHNGEIYSAIQEQIVPDHLALLPNGIGACSWVHGCGMPRVNEDHRVEDETTILKSIVTGIKKLLQNGVDEEQIAVALVPPPTTPVVANCSCGRLLSQEEGLPAQALPPGPQVAQDEEEETEAKTEEVEMPEEVTVNVDTLKTFLTANSVTESDVLQALETRKTLRQELATLIRDNTSLSDHDLGGMSDSVLKALADVCQKTAQISEPQGESQTALYVGRGLPDRGALAANGPVGVPERPTRTIRQIG